MPEGLLSDKFKKKKAFQLKSVKVIEKDNELKDMEEALIEQINPEELVKEIEEVLDKNNKTPMDDKDTELVILVSYGILPEIAKKYEKKILWNDKLTKGFIKWYIHNSGEYIKSISLKNLKEKGLEDKDIIHAIEDKLMFYDKLEAKIEQVKNPPELSEEKKKEADKLMKDVQKEMIIIETKTKKEYSLYEFLMGTGEFKNFMALDDYLRSIINKKEMTIENALAQAIVNLELEEKANEYIEAVNIAIQDEKQKTVQTPMKKVIQYQKNIEGYCLFLFYIMNNFMEFKQEPSDDIKEAISDILEELLKTGKLKINEKTGLVEEWK